MTGGILTSVSLSQGLWRMNILSYSFSLFTKYYLHKVNMYKSSFVQLTRFNHLMSEFIFQQNGCRLYTGLRNQRIIWERIFLFWIKDMEIIPNSLDMPPIENIWTVLGDKIVEIKSQPSNIQSLQESWTDYLRGSSKTWSCPVGYRL